ncbi:hypothetical protein [Hyphococcus luteus]|uniref:Uncharacterized protein n=1 Tax=Hyphococcus luteus TaxID=2058213 RepID=A0A2S7KAV8_9PROT|nr:hypothetical protein [Marinicaulis flavus]PQA89644.1 hypothetical protein CW354_01910 [Marinicaulis flavus]
MAFARKKDDAAPRVSAARLAAIAGGAPAEEPVAQSAAPARPATLEPDLSRIRPRGVNETPEQRKKRLGAKTINFTATILARVIIMGALALFMWDGYEITGAIQRGPAIAMVAMVADLGRVILKAMEPGTK